MEEKQIADLISYLTSLRFKGTELEGEIREKIFLKVPAFKIHHDLAYGAEQMHFELQFNKDHQFNAYRLESYKAIYRGAIEMNHAVIDGTDTGELETAMKKIDWRAYFEDDRESNDVFARQQIQLTMLRLSEEGGADGKRIAQELIYKYWPKEVYEEYKNPSVADPALFHERSREFIVTEYGTCNAHLAFHLLSGRLDYLYEKLQPCEIDRFLGNDLYGYLENVFSGNPRQFDISCFSNEAEGFLEITLPVSLKDGWCSAWGYSATLTLHPEIVHRTIGDIDTARLEEKMKEINWKDDHELFVFHEDREPDLSPKAEEIEGQLHQLGQHTAGAEIADKLKIKYWQDATYFEDRLPQSALDLMDALPKRKHFFMIEVPLRAAYNLLSGRAVPRAVMDNTQTGSGEWVRLNLDEEGSGGSYPLINIDGPLISELEAMLGMLPLAHHKQSYIKRLCQGDLTEILLLNGTKLKLEANPEQKRITLYTEDMRPVPFNFRLDPDWEPLQRENHLREKAAKTILQKQSPMKRKGKKL